ncbi:MAG: TetR/AcrR family transcriptional regulator [Mycobacteriales bacterium]
MTRLSNYQAARDRGATVLRRTLLDTASRLLTTEGPQALTMRRLAGAAGCSTTVLYTAFGSKDGIVEALYREGFARFARRLAAVPASPDPLHRLTELARAYRDNALAQRTYYGVMFAGAVPGFTPSSDARTEADATLQVLTDQVGACIDARVFASGDAHAMAEVLWAAAHGAVSLELGGYFSDAQAARRCFDTLTTAAGALFLRAQPRRS